MAITYPASYSSVQGDGGNNGLAITTDTTPDADDILVVGMCVNGNADTITPPGGWTEATVGDNSIASTGGQIRAWYLVDPADSTTYTWTVGTSTRRSIVGVLVRGVDNTTPVDVKGSLQNAPGTNHTPPSLTTTVDNAGVVDFIGLRQFAPDTANFTVPASGLTWTEQKDVQGADSNNNIRLACGTAVAGAAGALSTAVWTSADPNEDTIIIRVAFKPAGGATDATVNASVISGTTTMPAPTLQTGSTVSATPITGTTTMPAPAVQTGSTVTATPIAGVTTMPAATVQTGSTVTATPIAGVTIMSAPTLQTGQTVTAVPIAGVTTMPAPSVQAGGATITATPIVGTTTMPAPAVQTGSTVSASPILGVTTMPAPSISIPAAGMLGQLHGPLPIALGSVVVHTGTIAGSIS